MNNIMSYLKENGYKSFKDYPFNIIDAVIMVNIGYLPLEGCGVMDLEEKRTVKMALNAFLGQPELFERCIWRKRDPRFAMAITHAERYADLEVFGYVDNVNDMNESQFSALSFVFPDNSIFVAFRGTDTTFVGWKEDLNMLFESVTPAQVQAAGYLNTVASAYPNAKFFLGGHSKGGNLSMYAGAFCLPEVQKRIKLAFDFDGPGFSKSILESEEYKRIRYRIISVVPESSIVGLIFEHSDRYGVIKSSQRGVFQHDIYSWKVEGNDFVYAKKISRSSMKNQLVLREILNNLDTEQREQLVDTLYRMVLKTQVKTTKDWMKATLKNFSVLIASFKSLSKEEKEFLLSTGRKVTSFFLKASVLNDDTLNKLDR